MTTLYPGAQWRPLGTQTQPKMSGHDVVCLHTMVGSLAGTDTYFKANGYAGTESHFGVGHSGIVYQWQDLNHTADANYKGSSTVISIETADYGEGPFGKWNTSGDNVPEWTPQQIEAIAKIIAWCCKQYDIPCVLIPDSKAGRRGIGYHAQGVPSKKGATVSQTGGVLWSSAVGKVCPGKKRIAQIPEVIERAQEIMGVPVTSRIPVPPQAGEVMVPVQFTVNKDNKFRTSIKVENKSRVADTSWFTLGVSSGPGVLPNPALVRWIITVHDEKGKPSRARPEWEGFYMSYGGHYACEIPSGARTLVLEGSVDTGIIPIASVWHLR